MQFEFNLIYVRQQSGVYLLTVLFKKFVITFCFLTFLYLFYIFKFVFNFNFQVFIIPINF